MKVWFKSSAWMTKRKALSEARKMSRPSEGQEPLKTRVVKEVCYRVEYCVDYPSGNSSTVTFPK